ncbi:DegT/DnrJ/EryC1/StrS family aminotransferase [Fulvivirga lutea]|uniref:DegT/DnrJ/EryC1/StrS family aminotransferase n=1 Tax=Fulvivirga lutea TaxID=2810512 RepID=A0A974WKS3_9BACT|nr:DegT/DnrJ/EryC1/StrS family aminotransferase [Fulvivirga lutea]QSE97188.1 DegT/DnrJ/EryC1/StrS family aminotransferase [Fulvivirga lutea]
MIPFANPSLRFQQFENRLNQSFSEVLNSGQLILGNQVEKFESNFSQYIGTNYCIGVNSCTDAITLSLKASNINSGDEVITTGLTAPATAIGIINSGATPVIVDIENNTHCIDINAIEDAISEKTKAIIPVHLHGFPADMPAIKEIAKNHNLIVIEDCAQAHGATINGQKVGSIGHFGVFSFYPTKNLGCPGDGGAISTNDVRAAEYIKTLRNYGIKDNRITNTGLNSRLDEVQAAILGVLLPELNDHNATRRMYARKYIAELESMDITLPVSSEDAVYHQFVIKVKNRDRVRQQLLGMGIATGIHYDKSLKYHPALANYCKELPIAHKACNEMISLPIQPEILDNHFDEIISALKTVLVG